MEGDPGMDPCLNLIGSNINDTNHDNHYILSNMSDEWTKTALCIPPAAHLVAALVKSSFSWLYVNEPCWVRRYRVNHTK